MEEKTEKIKSGRLLTQQVRYLEELDKLEKKRGAVQSIAEKCEVTHSTISRFFKSCIEKGYLTQNLEFTEKGKRILEWNKKLEKDVKTYLTNIGIKEDTDVFVKALVENVDSNILEKTISNRPVIGNELEMQKSTAIIDVSDIIDYGEHRVQISIFQIHTRKSLKKSMADRGFERYGVLVHNETESYLELTVKEMHGISRINGQDMTGHLSALKYIYHGTVQNAKIVNGKVKIPLDACTYENFGHGIIWGNVMITVECSVGEAHMPESTARLVFII